MSNIPAANRFGPVSNASKESCPLSPSGVVDGPSEPNASTLVASTVVFATVSS